jgi:hypothetical protein
MNGPSTKDGHVVMPEEAFEQFLELAAERGAKRALVVRFRHLAAIATCPRPNVGISRTTRNDKVLVTFLNVTFVC